MYYRYVRPEWLEQQKRAHLPSSGAAFLSANDILTSWFLRTTRPAAGTMVVNMRNRTPGVEDKHCGTYGTLMIYYPAEYSEAANIRRSVTNMSPACTPDGGQQRPGQGGNVGTTTSWHMFY